MPYIRPEYREKFKTSINQISYDITGTGEFNYCISSIAFALLQRDPEGGYEAMSAIRAAMNDASDEFYRRVMAPYEDQKMKENGDVY